MLRAVDLRDATAPDPVAYMDAAARSRNGSDYKARLLAAMDVRPNHVVVDLGCGPGTDLGALAGAVTVGGRVLGVDRDPRMLGEARRRFAGRTAVELALADLHELPLRDASVDRIRTDRVLQHVRAPASAIDEARRVLRPGGILGMAEPDWDTFTVADEDLATSRAFARFSAGQVRNPTLGRQLVRIASEGGFLIRTVEAIAVTFREYDEADHILGLQRNSARAVAAGALAEPDATAWLQRLASVPFLAAFTLYLVTAQAHQHRAD